MFKQTTDLTIMYHVNSVAGVEYLQNCIMVHLLSAASFSFFLDILKATLNPAFFSLHHLAVAKEL